LKILERDGGVWYADLNNVEFMFDVLEYVYDWNHPWIAERILGDQHSIGFVLLSGSSRVVD
jgi:hypothetical protein